MVQPTESQPIKKAKEEDLSAEQNFSIGQVVYILSGNGQVVLPAMVVEESVIQTLNSKNTSWKLAIGKSGDAAKPQKIIDSKKINGEIYKSLDEISEILQRRLSSFINKLVLSAREREQTWYGPLLKKAQIQEHTQPSVLAVKTRSPQGEQLDPESFLNEIESTDSSQASSGPLSSLKNINSKEELRERLKEMSLASDEENDINMTIVPTPAEALDRQISDNDVQMITGPDGVKYAVKIKV